jgi:transposase
LEVRRRIAGRMLKQGYGPSAVAEAVGASLSSVKRWQKAVQDGGLKALCAKPHPGKKPRLDQSQKQQLVTILLAGPRACGYSTDLWTCSRVREVIANRFEVEYHADHVWKLLRSLGWSCQKPEQRARERDEQAIRRWRRRDWPRIKKELRKAS